MGQQIGSFFKSKYTGQQIENMLDSATNIADQYDPAASYVVGDLVLYNNGLYVCTGATSGTFDPTKWTATSLFAVLSGLASSYTDPNSDGNVVIGVDSTVGTKTIKSISFPSLTNKYVFPFAQYIRTDASNDPDNASFDVEIPDAEEAPMHSTVIKGKTASVNQNLALQPNGSYNATTSVSGHKITVTPTVQGGYCGWNGAFLPHTFYFGYDLDVTQGNYVRTLAYGTGFQTLINSTYASGRCETIAQFAETKTIVGIYGANVWESFSVNNVQLIDLSLIFDSATLTSIGTDVSKLKQAWLAKFGTPLPLYIPYDAGSLANVNGKYRMRGKNAFDYSDIANITIPSGVVRSGYEANLAAGTWTLSRGSGDTIYYQLGDADAASVAANGSVTFTLSTVTHFWAWVGSGSNMTNVPYIQLEESASKTDFEPYYNGGTIDCSTAPLNGFDDTVCDVKDFATGERTTKCATVNLGDLSWTYGSGYFTGSTLSVTAPTAPKGVCPKYKVVPTAVASLTDGDLRVNAQAVYIKDSAYSDAATFKTAMNGVYLCYEMLTPTTTTETPQPLTTEYGYNVLEPVSGGVQSAEVDTVYYENIAGYIDKKLAEG